MDSKSAICFLLLVLSSSALFIAIQAVQPYEETDQPKPSGINVGSVSLLLSDKGYHAMSLTLDAILEAVIPTQFKNHNTTTLTLFCPKDQAFFNSKYPQPPLTLLQYHLVPFKIDKDTMEASLHHGDKVDTLLPGHPLVVTSLPGASGYASLNQIKVTEWDLYNNGRLIVHGVEDFFDPAFQTLRYPKYDALIVKEVPSRGFSNYLLEATQNWLVLLALAAASSSALILVFIFCAKPSEKDDVQYSPLGHVI